jgi:hypothetical protein
LLPTSAGLRTGLTFVAVAFVLAAAFLRSGLAFFVLSLAPLARLTAFFVLAALAALALSRLAAAALVLLIHLDSPLLRNDNGSRYLAFLTRSGLSKEWH